MIPKFPHITSARMKRNVFLHKICKRLFLYVESLEHEYDMVFLNNNKNLIESRTMHSYFELPFLSKPKKKRQTKKKTNDQNRKEKYNVLVRHKCTYRAILRWVWASISPHSNQIYWYAKNKCDMNTRFIKWGIIFDFSIYLTVSMSFCFHFQFHLREWERKPATNNRNSFLSQLFLKVHLKNVCWHYV